MKENILQEFNQRRKIVNPKISHIFDEKLIFSIICVKCGNDNNRIFKEEESVGISKLLRLIHNIVDKIFKYLVEENVSINFRRRKIDDIRNYFTEEIKQINKARDIKEFNLYSFNLH